MRLQIVALGRCLPSRCVSNQELEPLLQRSAPWIEKRCGVRTRYWVNKETAPGLAAEAAREALLKSGLAVGDIDLVINASGTPWQVLPDGSAWQQRELGLNCSGFSVHSTCLGFLNALEIAGSFLQTGAYRNILITVSEVCSRALNFQHPESAALFGDGAVAAVVRATPPGEDSGLLKTLFRTYPQGCELTEIRGGGSRRHPADPATKPEDNLFSMNGPALLRLARELLPVFLEELMPGLSRGLNDVDRVFPHQASRLGLSILSRFGWPAEKTETVLAELGNVVAASIPLCLYQAQEAGRLVRGGKVLLLGTGAGFSMGAVLMRY